MKQVLLAGLFLLMTLAVQADLVVEPETPSKEDSQKEAEKTGGSLAGIEVLIISALAGGTVYFTRKKKN